MSPSGDGWFGRPILRPAKEPPLPQIQHPAGHPHLDGEIGFNDVQATNFRALIPGWETYTNGTKQHQPYVKVTASLNPNHQLNGYWQHDRINVDNNRAEFYEKILLAGAGGSVFGGKLTSLWGTNTTTQLTATYNNKSGNNQATRDLLPGSGPWLDFTADTFISGGIIRGTGDVGIGGNVQSIDFQPASMLIFRGDLTRFVEDWGALMSLGSGPFLLRVSNTTVSRTIAMTV